MFPNFEMFCQVMDQCTENYECLVINNNAKSNKLSDQVFWYKADDHDDFKLGSREYWDYDRQRGGSSGSGGGSENLNKKYVVDKKY
jgi:hypothetical protein